MSSRGRRRKRGGSGNSSDGGNNSNGNSLNGGNSNGKSGKGNRNDGAKSSKGGRNRNNSGDSGKSKAGRQKAKQKAPKFDAPDFWGDNELLPDPRGYEVNLEDTTAILRSLGRPPIPGSEAAAEYHFAMVYERSVNLAKALAAAGGLDQEQEDPAPDTSDSETPAG